MNTTKNCKFLHIPSGLVFDNRKQATLVMGAARYRRALKNREFIFNYES